MLLSSWLLFRLFGGLCSAAPSAGGVPQGGGGPRSLSAAASRSPGVAVAWLARSGSGSRVRAG